MKKLTMIILSLVWVIPMLAQDFDPKPPADPYTRYKLTTSATPTGYTSGSGMYMSDAVVTIGTSSSGSNYTFSHWNKNGEYYGNQSNFTYTMEAEAVHFEAVYDYTPAPPTDPQYTNKHKLYLTNNDASACSFNRTSGLGVETDAWVLVKATMSSGYDFLGWFEDGVKISESLSFNYQMPDKDVTLLAKFDYNPTLPGDPGSVNGDNVHNAKLGDVNGDGEVNTTDAVMVINYYLGKITEINKSVGDMNGDNEINTTDAVSIINKYLNK